MQGTRVRKCCIKCVRKHIAQAIILMQESVLGYPSHRYLAMGHLAEAESESEGEHLELARRIRSSRINIENGKYPENLLSLIEYTETLDTECVSCSDGFRN